MNEILEDKEEANTSNIRKSKTASILKEYRKCLVLSLTGGKAQIMDLDSCVTVEVEIPKELKGKGVIEPGRKILFLYREGKYDLGIET